MIKVLLIILLFLNFGNNLTLNGKVTDECPFYTTLVG